MLNGADSNIAENDKAAEYLKVKRFVTRTGDAGITQKLLLKSVGGSIEKRRRNDIIETLMASQEIYYAKVRSEKGQTKVRFWDARHLPEGAEILPLE